MYVVLGEIPLHEMHALQMYGNCPTNNMSNVGNLHEEFLTNEPSFYWLKDIRLRNDYYCNKMCIYFSPLLLEQSALEHCAFVSVVSSSLCVFLAVFVLVCTEMLSQRWRRLLGLIIWATHLTMGYTFIFSSPIILPWDQVTSPPLRLYFCCKLLF